LKIKKPFVKPIIDGVLLMTTDTSEKGLETLIMRHMTGTDGLVVVPNRVAERPQAYGGTGYTAGSAAVLRWRRT
jgi:hypothetical protein